MDNLLSLAERGDAVAHSIYIDLKSTLHARGVLTFKQRKYIRLWMAGYEDQQIAWMHGITRQGVNYVINSGARAISKKLIE